MVLVPGSFLFIAEERSGAAGQQSRRTAVHKTGQIHRFQIFRAMA
jgi:hypothetical protein